MSWASRFEKEEAADFLRWALSSGWQEKIANEIPLMERLVFLAYHICRVEHPDIFSRLNNREFDRETLEENVAHIEAMRLGWGSAQYAKPGRVCQGSRSAAGDLSEWVVLRHPGLTEEQVSDWMRGGFALAFSDLNEPPQRFLALLDRQR